MWLAWAPAESVTVMTYVPALNPDFAATVWDDIAEPPFEEVHEIVEYGGVPPETVVAAIEPFVRPTAHPTMAPAVSVGASAV